MKVSKHAVGSVVRVSLVSFQTKDNIVSIYRLLFELSSDIIVKLKQMLTVRL